MISTISSLRFLERKMLVLERYCKSINFDVFSKFWSLNSSNFQNFKIFKLLGAAGQVVVAQKDGANWLCTDSLEGNLMTELKGTGRGAAELLSQAVITDGKWHRIGLVWDGSNRTLYVDGVAVAEDAQANLAASENGLYIGAGTAMEPGSFWSGLIDDVRIYNRAVKP